MENNNIINNNNIIKNNNIIENNIEKIIIVLLLIILFIVFIYYISQPKPIPKPIPKPKPTPITQNLANCEINRLYKEWEYTNKICDPSDNTTLIATKRSRQIIINKINDNKKCSFLPLANEIILDTSGGFFF